MLALTHHIIVKVAALQAGISHFQGNAILGDDIVISDEDVSSHYYNLLTNLGVKISLFKSMISYDFLEFAKRIQTREGIDVSPVGPGLILACLRRKEFYGLLYSSLLTLGYTKLSAFSNFMESLPGMRPSVMLSVLWQCFGLRPAILNGSISAPHRGLD